MITKQTVFILGAGASTPYGYPTGAGLKKMICYESRELLDQLIPIADGHGSGWEKDKKDTIKKHTVKFIERFSQVPSDFIDRFLETNAKVPDIPETGRILIALSILYSEKKSKFLNDEAGKDIALDWYKDLFLLMDEKLRGFDAYLEFKKNKVNFITFNYDRSLEHFLYNSLLQTYGSINLREHRPLDLIPFKFIHVYGKIDNFPWEDPSGSEYGTKYGVRDILRVADNIKLIHERDNKFLNEIKELVREAENIFFLGFGYDEDNMRALGWPKNFNANKDIFGTAFNLSQSRIGEIRAMIQRGFKNPTLTHVHPIIKPLDCRRLLDEYRNRLN